MTLDSCRRLRAILYVRLSESSERSTSIQGQTDDLVALAIARSWDVVATFADDGISGGKQRANAVEALAMLADGRADVLAVYAYDRWSRMGLEDTAPLLAALRMRAATAHPARFIAVRESLDSDTSDFELRLGIAASLAKDERERIRSRVAASRARLRVAGRFAGGCPPFGYRSAEHPTLPAARTLAIDEDEAVVVVEVAHRVIAGESLVKIADDLNARGIARPRSPYRLASHRGASTLDDLGKELYRGLWEQSRIRDLWSGEHLLGRMVSKGAALLGADGVPAQPYPAILTLEEHQRIKARFVGVKRGHQRKRRAKHLLSGLVYCDGCNGRMYPRGDYKKGDVYFGCSASARGEVCPIGHPRIKAKLVEERVVGLFLLRVGDMPEVERVETTASDTAAKLAEVRALIDDTTARMADRSADRLALLTRLDALQAEEERLEALPVEVTVEERLTGRTVAEAWLADDNLDARRKLLAGWVDYATVKAARSRGHVIDNRRVSIIWTPAAEAIEWPEVDLAEADGGERRAETPVGA